MADGRETRAAIDSETVRGLLLINGGGAVALLAFLSSIIGKPEFSLLTQAVMLATFLFQVGLVAAVVHNRFRRLCSLEYAKKQENRKSCTLFGRALKEPCICHWSTGFMWASILAFVVAGVVVLVAGLCVARQSSHVEQPQAQVVTGLLPNNSFKPTPLRGAA
jgi:ABC-type polysaccharide/polyol phosphate export permease